MSPTIVLNRNTTNPNIPRVPVPGFSDTFNRADGLLGVTPGGKPWSVDQGNWSVISNMATFDGSKSYSYATVDALTADGKLTAKIGALTAEGSSAMGLVFRWTDINNYIRVYLRNGGANNAAILHRKNGVDTNTWAVAGSPLVTANSTIVVTGVGSSLSVAIDGVTALTATTPVLTGTSHGMVGVSTGTGTRFDSISFTPAV